MAPMTRAQRREYYAKQRRLQKYRERLQREQARAQRSLQALEQALVDLGLPETVAAEVQWRLKTVGKLLGKIFGLMFPTLFGCRTYHELTPGAGLGQEPARSASWVPCPSRSGCGSCSTAGRTSWPTLWRHVEDKSPATRSRWQWTWVGDDSVFKKAGQQLGLVGTWYSGQEHRVRRGIDGLLLVVVIGDGQAGHPGGLHRPSPGPRGAWPALPRQADLVAGDAGSDLDCPAAAGPALPAPLVVADSWFGDSKLLAHVAHHQRGTVVVEGKRTYVFQLPDGRRVTGQELLTRADWPWRDSLQLPGMRYVRLTATSPTYGPVTLVIVDEPGQERSYLLCQATPLTAPRLIRAWKRRSWIEHYFRTLKHLLATEACQVHGEDAYYGHLVLRLLAGLVLLYTARRLLKGPRDDGRDRVQPEASLALPYTQKTWNYTDFHGTSAWRPHEC